MLSVERPPADFDADTADWRVAAAEQRVARYLASLGYVVEDTRDACGRWDFRIHQSGATYTVDVKADRIFDTSGNVVFEERHVYPDGRSDDGWGVCPHLDILAMVGVDSWRCAFLRLPPFRAFVRQGKGKRFRRENRRGGYVTEGVVISLADAWVSGALFHLAHLPRDGVGDA